MDVTQFDNVASAAAAVSGTLGSKLSAIVPGGMDSDVLARELIAIWSVPVETVQPRRNRPAHVARLRWVIRNEDLKLFDSVLDGLSASSAVGLFLSDSWDKGSAVAIVAMLAKLLKLSYNAVKKGVVLDGRAFAVMAVLIQQSGGLTDEQILAHVSPKQDDWTLAQVRQVLAELGSAASRSGKIALVWQSTDQTWRTCDV